MKISYRRVYAKLRNRTFFSIGEVNAAFVEKTREHSPEFYIRQAARRSDTLAELFTSFFEKSEIPETQYRRCDGLLSLQRKTDPVVFERVCRYALENGILTYKSIKRVVDTTFQNFFRKMFKL